MARTRRLTACGRAGVGAAVLAACAAAAPQPLALPREALPTDDASCTSSSAAQKPVLFAFRVLVRGDGIARGDAAGLTVCTVPAPGATRAELSVSGTGPLRATPRAHVWEAPTAGRRLTSTVQLHAVRAGQGQVSVVIEQWREEGLVGRARRVAYVLTTADAVYVSLRSARETQELRLVDLHRRGVLDDAELTEEVARLRPRD